MYKTRTLLLSGTLALLTFSGAAFAHDGDDDHGTGGSGGGQGQGAGAVYPTFNMDQLGHLSLQTLGFGNASVQGNSCWGWTDPATNHEYALMGLTNGTAFVDVTDPLNPVHLGNLPSHTGNSTWRDVRVFENRAYVVADNNGAHGMQMFDLTRLRGATSVQSWTEDGHYAGVGRTHTIGINESTGFAYLSGTDTVSGGLHVVDVRPNSPTYMQKVGGFSGDGYTHEAQIVNYTGPDARFAGREIAFAANEDTVTIVDVTDKSAMSQISRTGYPNAKYTHQGWLTEDQRYFVYNDELDELQVAGINKPRTHVMRVDDLMNPVYVGYFEGTETAIDHNLYIKDGLIYESNYTAGLRVLKINDIATANFEEVGWIDTRPGDTGEAFRGAWNNYPFFKSGTIVISDINEGLVLARYNPVPEPATLLALGGGIAAMAIRRRRKL